MKKYLLSLDQGTTSSRAIVFDLAGNPVAKASREFTQYFPREGWVEHDAEEIFESQLATAREALETAGLSANDIAAIGITNQRETTVVWDKETGKPIAPAIVWQCRRTAEHCANLKARGLAPLIRQKTGLAPDPYFSATKIAWLLENTAGAAQKAREGKLLFGTVDTWLIWNLTAGRVHATDPSNASRTMLFNIHKMTWDEELLVLFGIPRCMLPEVRDTASLFGEADPSHLGAAIPIAGVAGDQQAALFGQSCFETGDVKNTYGTGGFLLMNTGDTPIPSKNGLLTTVGWRIAGKTTYVLEGSVFIAGAAIQWLRDGLGLLATARESEAIAASVPDSGGVYFLPAFVGLGTPHWEADVRGTICGITRGTTRAHLVRATLDAIALQTVDVLDAMQSDTGLKIPCLRVDGGAAANNLLVQLQSDYANLPIARPQSVESTAWGAAALAGLTVGLFDSTSTLAGLSAKAETFHPHMTAEARGGVRDGWKRAIESARTFAKK